MAQDIIADALNMIRNASLARKENVEIKIISNVLIEILKIMKQKGAIKKYKINSIEKSIEVVLGDVTDCKAIKPRYTVKKTGIEKYKRRYLPSRNLGTVVLSTNKGLMTHEEANKENIGGCLIAYFY